MKETDLLTPNLQMARTVESLTNVKDELANPSDKLSQFRQQAHRAEIREFCRRDATRRFFLNRQGHSSSEIRLTLYVFLKSFGVFRVQRATSFEDFCVAGVGLNRSALPLYVFLVESVREKHTLCMKGR
jgi:hypothetical protein